MQLPQTLSLSLMQTRWAAILNPFLASPTNQIQILENVKLANGSTTINHLLGHQMQGWYIVDVNGAATIYRSQPFNDKTLTLTSSAAVTVNIGVF
jgi:hypothetical protein